MRQRRLFPLFIVLAVCLASIAFMPFGAGPYSAVYGPTSALRAQRALALLWFAMLYLVAVAPPAARMIFASCLQLVAVVGEPEAADCPPLLALRC